MGVGVREGSVGACCELDRGKMGRAVVRQADLIVASFVKRVSSLSSTYTLKQLTPLVRGVQLCEAARIPIGRVGHRVL